MLSLTGEPVFGNVATFPTLCLLKSNPKKETYRCTSHIVAVYIYTSLWLGTVSLPSCLVVVFCDLLLAEICTTAVLPKTCSPVRDNVNIPHLPSSPQKDSGQNCQTSEISGAGQEHSTYLLLRPAASSLHWPRVTSPPTRPSRAPSFTWPSALQVQGNLFQHSVKVRSTLLLIRKVSKRLLPETCLEKVLLILSFPCNTCTSASSCRRHLHLQDNRIGGDLILLRRRVDVCIEHSHFTVSFTPPTKHGRCKSLKVQILQYQIRLLVAFVLACAIYYYIRDSRNCVNNRRTSSANML